MPEEVEKLAILIFKAVALFTLFSFFVILTGIRRSYFLKTISAGG
jgi:hypothetical protein